MDNIKKREIKDYFKDYFTDAYGFQIMDVGKKNALEILESLNEYKIICKKRVSVGFK